MDGLDKMGRSARTEEVPWDSITGSGDDRDDDDDDEDRGRFGVRTTVGTECVDGESREAKTLDRPRHWSSCKPYMRTQTSPSSGSRVLPAEISTSSQDASGPPQKTWYKVVPSGNNATMFGNCSRQYTGWLLTSTTRRTAG